MKIFAEIKNGELELIDKKALSNMSGRVVLIIEKEKESKSLAYYAAEIQARASQPHELARLLVDMSVDFAQSSNNKIHYAVAKAQFINENKGFGTEKPLSDSAVNAKFMTTKDGLEHTKNEIYIKTMTSLMSNIKSALRNLENEARGNY